MPEESATTPAAAPVADATPVASPEDTQHAAEATVDPILEDIQKDTKKPKAEKKAEVKTEAKVEETTSDEDDEPDFTEADDKTKNLRAWNLKQAQKVADAKKEVEEAQKALDEKAAALAAKEKELETKATAKIEAKTEEPADNPKVALTNYKDVPDHVLQYTDETGQPAFNPGEQAIREMVRGLAKDVEAIAAVTQERDDLKARLEALEAQVLPDEAGFTQSDRMRMAHHARTQAEEAATTLKDEYGIDVEPVAILAATTKFADSFIKLGEFSSSKALEADAMIRCWKHANRNDLAELQAKSKEKTPDKEEKKAVPTLTKGTGKGTRETEPTDEDDLILRDVRKENARLEALNGRR